MSTPLLDPITDRPVRWGVVGPGRIADNVVRDLAGMPGGVPHAVASGSLDRARTFSDTRCTPTGSSAWDCCTNR